MHRAKSTESRPIIAFREIRRIINVQDTKQIEKDLLFFYSKKSSILQIMLMLLLLLQLIFGTVHVFCKILNLPDGSKYKIYICIIKLPC